MSGNKKELVAPDWQKNAFFPRTRDLLVSRQMTQRHFFPIPRHLSPVILANATIVSFVLLRNYRSNFHFYSQCEPTPNQKSARKCCNLSRHFTRKITKGIHSCKPASLNCPIEGTQCFRLCTFCSVGINVLPEQPQVCQYSEPVMKDHSEERPLMRDHPDYNKDHSEERPL